MTISRKRSKTVHPADCLLSGNVLPRCNVITANAFPHSVDGAVRITGTLPFYGVQTTFPNTTNRHPGSLQHAPSHLTQGLHSRNQVDS